MKRRLGLMQMLFIVILKMVADSKGIIIKKIVEQKINLDNQLVRILS